MRTQTSTSKNAPYSQVTADLRKRAFTVAVISDSDASQSFRVSSGIVSALLTLGKDVQLIDITDITKKEALKNSEILVVNCQAGINKTIIDVANHANIIIVVHSLNTSNVVGSNNIILNVLAKSCYRNKFHIAIVNAENKTTGLQTFNTLYKFIDEHLVVFPDLFCVVEMNMDDQQQFEIYLTAINKIILS